MIYRSNARFVMEGIEGAIVPLVVLITWPLSRRWFDNWGSEKSEHEDDWLGDSFAPKADHIYTRAIGIDAPSEHVWAWVVQFGLGRAGFYSYELLERLAGIPVRNVESIVPEYQSISGGDEVKLHPKAPGIPVGAVTEGRHICFGEYGEVGKSTTDPRRSWSMYIQPTGERTCRLILRGCVEPLREPTLLKRVALALEAPIDFTMEQRMLRTIRRLAEKTRTKAAARSRTLTTRRAPAHLRHT